MRFAYADYKPRLLASSPIAPGVRSHVLGPATLPTFDRVAIGLDAGTTWRLPRSSINQVYTVIEGRGTSTIGNETFEWHAGDMIAAPLPCGPRSSIGPSARRCCSAYRTSR